MKELHLHHFLHVDSHRVSLHRCKCRRILRVRVPSVLEEAIIIQPVACQGRMRWYEVICIAGLQNVLHSNDSRHAATKDLQARSKVCRRSREETWILMWLWSWSLQQLVCGKSGLSRIVCVCPVFLTLRQRPWRMVKAHWSSFLHNVGSLCFSYSVMSQYFAKAGK